MGKTQAGAVWLDAEKTTPYDFYQYWRNIDDADVIKCLKMLTFVPLSEIKQMEHLQGSELNAVKSLLAYQLTKAVHGEETAAEVEEAAKAIFSKGSSSENMPTTEISAEQITSGIGILDLMLRTSLIPSKAEGRRLIAQGGININDEKVDDFSLIINQSHFINGELIIKKGKKVYHRVILNTN